MSAKATAAKAVHATAPPAGKAAAKPSDEKDGCKASGEEKGEALGSRFQRFEVSKVSKDHGELILSSNCWIEKKPELDAPASLWGNGGRGLTAVVGCGAVAVRLAPIGYAGSGREQG